MMDELYHDLILEHGLNPRNHRVLEDATHQGEGFNPLCGDKIVLYLELEQDSIKQATFKGAGCAIALASASLMTEGLVGKTLMEAKALFEAFQILVTGEDEISNGDVSLGKLLALKGVSGFPTRIKCATLAWHTLQATLKKEKCVATTETEK